MIHFSPALVSNIHRNIYIYIVKQTNQQRNKQYRESIEMMSYIIPRGLEKKKDYQENRKEVINYKKK